MNFYPTSMPSVVAVNGRFRVHKITGVQRYAEELSRRLARRVTFVEPKRKLKGARGHMWEQIALPARVGSGILWSPCNTGPCWFSRQVVTIHDLFALEHPEWFSKNFARCYRAIIPTLVRNVRRVIAVSEYTKSRIMRLTGVSGEKITVIHNGVGRQFQPQSESAVATARQTLGLPPGRYLLSVASVEPRKNVKRILEAWQKILPLIAPDWHLVLAGRLSTDNAFASLDSEPRLPRVIFPGYVEEQCLPGLYAGAGAFLFPSLAEGFGLPPLEAMACGTPVLTSRCSSLSEVTGKAALLVDPLNTDEIVRGIQTLVRDDRTREYLWRQGLEQASRFSWDSSADETWRTLEQELTV
ncbi:MAG: glycosyltransferase family 1 protein [Bryobacteraceae bacterium]